jgi:hypothetical protein
MLFMVKWICYAERHTLVFPTSQAFEQQSEFCVQASPSAAHGGSVVVVVVVVVGVQLVTEQYPSEQLITAVAVSPLNSL